jgi:hypothetical protein
MNSVLQWGTSRNYLASSGLYNLSRNRVKVLNILFPRAPTHFCESPLFKYFTYHLAKLHKHERNSQRDCVSLQLSKALLSRLLWNQTDQLKFRKYPFPQKAYGDVPYELERFHGSKSTLDMLVVCVRFQILTATRKMMTVGWNLAPCSLIDWLTALSGQ